MEAETKKQQLDLNDGTFVPEILEKTIMKKAASERLRAEVGLEVEEEGKEVEVVVSDEEGKEGRKKREGGREKPKSVWDRLYKSQTTSVGKKERQRKEREARFTFQPTLATAAAEGGREGGHGRRSPTTGQKSATTTAATSSNSSSGSSKNDVHDRLYAEGKTRLQRFEERRAKLPPGCTFHPTLTGTPSAGLATAAGAAAATATTAEGEREKKGGSTRAEGKYLHGKEKGKKI